MDKKRIIGEVAARHGVRLDEDDPALILVTITELMLQEARVEFEATARQATADLLAAAERVQSLAGAASARAAKQAQGGNQVTMVDELRRGSVLRMALFFGGVLSSLLLFLAGIWIGKVVLQ